VLTFAAVGTPPSHKPAAPPSQAAAGPAEGPGEGALEAAAEQAASPDLDAGADGDPQPQAASSRERADVAHQPTERVTPSDPAGWIGRVLDERYRVARLLGEGGMGAVFVAEHLTLRKSVALKVVRAELAGNGEVAARFAREAMATAQFEHPHVASAIDYGTLPEGGAYFVMQLVRGRSLRGLIAGGKRLAWRRACEIMAQVADALSAAKAAGIIHRDLKPDNILVERREDGSDLVKVLDFGIAHVTPREMSAPIGTQAHVGLTRVGTVMGTPGYMAPEQAVGDKIDHRTDLYALGVVLWESIAGRELWDGPDLTSVVTRQMTEAVPRLREIADDPSLPAELDELLQRLTARAAAERPEHAAEVRDALRRLAQSSDSALSPARALAVLHNLRDSSVGPWVRQAVTRYGAQPPTMRRLQAAGAAVALIALALVILPGGSDAPPPKAAEPAAAGGAAPSPQAGAKAEPTVIDQVVKAAAEVVQKATPRPREHAIPQEVAADVKLMLDGETFRERRNAAQRVLAFKPAERVPGHLRVIAELEGSRGCRTRQDAIAKMQQQRDVRYLPPLQRLARASRSGCGFLGLSDCYSCIRNDVRDAIDAIQQTLPQPGAAPAR